VTTRKSATGTTGAKQPTGTREAKISESSSLSDCVSHASEMEEGTLGSCLTINSKDARNIIAEQASSNLRRTRSLPVTY
jgi:hypothetical protein